MKKSRNRGTSTGSLHKEDHRRPYGGKGNVTVERTPQDTYQSEEIRNIAQRGTVKHASVHSVTREYYCTHPLVLTQLIKLPNRCRILEYV
jgi:hypothetical protein